MIIQMKVPAEFIGRLSSQQLIRSGTILKDVSNGKIVGHLKEVGNLGLNLSQIPLNPLNLASNIAQNIQLNDIRNTLDALQMTTNIAAFASVASLGISVAGFAVVVNRLNRLESKLDSVATEVQEINTTLKGLDLKWEMLTNAKIMNASERMIHAENSHNVSRQQDLLRDSNKEFSQLRSYFYNVLSELKPEIQSELSIEQVREFFSRYFTVSIGQLQSEFMLDDLGAYRSTLNVINEEIRKLTHFKTQEVYRSRSDNRVALDIFFDHNELARSVNNLKSFTVETRERINSFGTEIDYIENNQIKPTEYLKILKKQEPNIVLIPSKI